MTNFDFIKNMNIEQMADFIRLISYYEDDTTPMLSFTLDEKCKSLRCQKNEIIKWLNSEKIN